MKWAWPSDRAFKTGRYFKTSGSPVEVPALSLVGRAEFSEESRAGVSHPSGIWFNEPVKELTLRSQRYDLNYTLLHFANDMPAADFSERIESDTYDRFMGRG
jgi:hypothetical protein